jgi:hypothetical protein
MINDGINNVPDNTIAIFTDPFNTSWQFNDKDRLFNIISKPPKKREWFTSHFYRCLPLTIGNQYGFVITTEFDFSFVWDGGEETDSIKIFFPNSKESLEDKYPNIQSHFGSGILTVSTPFWIRTPPGVNIMTVNPPNYIIPNVTTMTGVVETDNIRRNFTFNLKVQIPNIQVNIPAGAPIAAFIPIPRNYADNFELKYAEDIFSEEAINEELEAVFNEDIYKSEVKTDGPGRHYLLGTDIYGNKFPDHQGT